MLSKLASSKVSITPASDLTNPATWALSTYAAPASAYWESNGYTVGIGPTSSTTSVRLIYIVAKDGVMSCWGTALSGFSAANTPVYVGAYDTVLGASDPMPLILFLAVGSTVSPPGATTRAPLQTAGVAATEIFTATHNWTSANTAVNIGAANPRAVTTSAGTLGSSADTNWPKSLGGVPTFRCHLSSFTATVSTNSSKGLLRGYSKYVRGGRLKSPHTARATHS